MKNLKTLEDYKAALLEEPSLRLRERLLGEADESGFTAGELAELAQAAALAWA